MILHNLLQQLQDLDRTSPEFHKQLSNFLRGNEYKNAVPSLLSEDLAWLVEYLDSVLCGISEFASVPFQEFLRELSKICGVNEVLPKSYTLSDPLLGCVYEGIFNGSKVRIRRVRMNPGGGPQKIKETFHQVAVVWKHLAHQNIVPLLGVTLDPLQLISDWMPGGDLPAYIANNPYADRLRLLSDVAEGLSYLHSCDVIHGDLKGSSVLVDAAGHARITDFGLATATHDLDSMRNASDWHGDSARWIAPEILEGRGTYSKKADVFSFAMVTIEAFASAVPFSDKPPRAAMLAIIGGERPPRPTHPALTDDLWTLTQRCWDQEPHLRPHALRISCVFGIPAWKRLIDRPLAKDERISLIADIFSDRDETEVVKCLRGGDAQSFVDVIDETLDSLGPWLRGKCLATLYRICGHQALLPRSVQIPLCYNRMDVPLYHGGFAEVWKGKHQGREVAVKVLKVYVTSNLVKITRRFCKEVVTWKALRHQNVLPLLGVTMSSNQFTMVSEWMVNGNVTEFVKTHTDANRFELLKDVARGLMYMHSQVMVHGDLKGANILIDKDGRARLADFGLLTIVSDSAHPTTSNSYKTAGTTRWMSPELIDPDRFGFKDSRPTKESDCYALGMVVLEVLTGQPPFSRYIGLTVMRKIVDGERPERPQGPEAMWFTDDLWGTLGQCWSPQPEVRPAVEAVLERLDRGSITWQPLPPSTDDVQTDSDMSALTTPSVAGPTTLRGGNQSPVLPQGHPRIVDTDRSSFQSTPGIQQRLDKPPALPESTNINQELAHPHDLNSRFNASIDHDLTGTSNLGHHSTNYQHQYARDVTPAPHVSGKFSIPPNNDPEGRTPWAISDNTSRRKSLPRLMTNPGVSRPQQQNLTGPKPFSQARLFVLPEHPPTPRALPESSSTKRPSSLNPHLNNETGVFNQEFQLPVGKYERLKNFTPVNDLDEPIIGASSDGTSPTPAEAARPFPTPDRRKHKKPTRVSDRTSMLRQVTGLWGGEADDITTEQSEDVSSALSTSAESPSRPKPLFKWVRGELIRKDTHGRVYTALNSTSGGMMVVKQLKISRAENGMRGGQAAAMSALRLESNTLKSLDHPNVVRYLGFGETSKYLNLFLEHVPGSSVASILRKQGRFDENVTKSFTCQILDGLDYLHSEGIIHRDLKADTILVDSGLCKITDFGISKKTDDSNTMGVYTPMQGAVFSMAPEVVNSQRGYNSKIDIWSIGCIVFEMWTGERPWNRQEIVAVLMQLYRSGGGPPLPEGFVLSPEADDLRNRCFAINPDERPTAGELRQHPYLVLPPDWEFTGFS